MPSPARKRKVFWVIGCFLGFIGVVVVPGVGKSEMEELQSDSQRLEENLKPIQKYRDATGVAMGCVNTFLPPSPPSPIMSDPKMKALQNFREAQTQLAQSTEKYVAAEEEHLHMMWWWNTPRVAKILPWYKRRYSNLQDGINARILWAKSELSDHSCSKH